MRSIWIGWDPRECDAFAVARASAIRRMCSNIPVSGIVLADVRASGMYTRPVERKTSGARWNLWDPISEAPMSTEFSISRFLTPMLARRGWALFCDADVMFRTPPEELFDLADDRYAVMCVKHEQKVSETHKMDGQLQTQYSRKNWSSVVLYNCDHPANRRLTLELFNSLPGRDLHAFCWLEDSEIGALPRSWNYLVGHSGRFETVDLAHFTLGVPSMEGCSGVPFADEWWEELYGWAR